MRMSERLKTGNKKQKLKKITNVSVITVFISYAANARISGSIT